MDDKHIFNNNKIDEEKAIDIHDLLNRFFRRKNLFLYITIPIFLIILVVQITKPYSPIYRATFDIGVSKERTVDGFFSSSQVTPTVQIGTVTQRVISNLLSVNLAEKVVDSLAFYAYVKDGNSDIKVEVKLRQDFEEPIGPLKLQITGGKFRIFKTGATAYEGRLNEYVDLDLFSLRIVALTDIPDGKTYALTVYPRDRMALALRNSLSIKVLEADKIEQEMGSSGVPFSGEGASKELVIAKTLFPGMSLIGILRISVHWGNPTDAKRIAEVLSELIIREDRREKSVQFIQSNTFIDSQLTLYQSKLSQLEENIRQFKERKKITDLKASTQALISQISAIESKKNQLQIEQKILKDLNAYLAVARVGNDTLPNFAASMLSDPILQDLYFQLLQADAGLKGLSKEYSIEHPKVLEKRANLGGLKEQMQQEVTKRTSTIVTEIASVESQITFLQAKLENVPEDEILLARLERDKETAEKLYTFFSEKLEETRVQEAGVTSDLKIINPPLVFSSPVNGRRPLLKLFIAFIMSILVGGIVIFIAEYIDNTVNDPDIIKEKIGLPIFASIPVIDYEEEKIKTAKLGDLLKISTWKLVKILTERFKKEKPVEKLRILTEDISSPEFEAFRKLSFNLNFAHPEKNYRVIYVTSPGPEDGKTFIALNLGVVLDAMGKRTILIDTDFRKKKGHLTDVTKLEKEEGLFDTLRGDAKLEDVIVSFNANPISSTPNYPSSLALLAVGKIPPNPFVFLESEKMKNLIRELKERYEYVIIDGVPLLLFADATYLANFADGVLLTVRYGRTGFKELENARDILLTAKLNVIGIVINGVPKTRGSYYYQYHHKYYTKYYKK